MNRNILIPIGCLIIILIIFISIYSKEHFIISEENIDYDIKEITSIGDTGIKGIKGKKGPVGPPGLYGPRGNSGPIGVIGPRGIRGVSSSTTNKNCHNVEGKCVNYGRGRVDLKLLENLGGNKIIIPPKKIGRCLDDKNQKIVSGKIKHPNKFLSEKDCVDWCFSDSDISGCEKNNNMIGKGCFKYKRSSNVSNTSNEENYACWINNNPESNGVAECPDQYYQNGFGIRHCKNNSLQIMLNCCQLGEIDNSKKSNYGNPGPRGLKGTRGNPGPYVSQKELELRCSANFFTPGKAIFSGAWVGRNYTVNPIRHSRDNSIFIYAIHNHIFTKMVGFKIVNNRPQRLEGRAKKGYFPLNSKSITSIWESTPSNLRNINKLRYNIRFI